MPVHWHIRFFTLWCAAKRHHTGRTPASRLSGAACVYQTTVSASDPDSNRHTRRCWLCTSSPACVPGLSTSKATGAPSRRIHWWLRCNVVVGRGNPCTHGGAKRFRYERALAQAQRRSAMRCRFDLRGCHPQPWRLNGIVFALSFGELRRTIRNQAAMVETTGTPVVSARYGDRAPPYLCGRFVAYHA